MNLNLTCVFFSFFFLHRKKKDKEYGVSRGVDFQGLSMEN